MRQILFAVGVVKPPTRRAELEAAVASLVGDPMWVRSVVADLSAEIAAELFEMADPAGVAEDGVFNYGRLQRRQTAVDWALERGLLVGSRYGYDWQMPAEVGLALRGADYRAPFTPHRPEPLTRAVGTGSVPSAASAAATAFAQQASAVLDSLARAPVPLTKSGGLGVRELGRLAKLAGADDLATRLTLELAASVGVIEDIGLSLRVSEYFNGWRQADPGPRYAALLWAWWQHLLTPTEAVDADGKAIRPLSWPTTRTNGSVARAALIAAMAALGDETAVDRASIAESVLWDRPIVGLITQDGPDSLATLWREAELLGVIAVGALSDLGRALHAADQDELASLSAAMLPASNEQALFGSDLTVLVAGSPSARVSALLDSAADRESRGAGITWRFSESSVRRAFDEGAQAGVLASELAAIASRELPQPLRYLIADVARRHGTLRLSPAASVLRSEDAALLAEAAADRKLRQLGLRLLGPTVLSSEKSMADTLLALRKAGYFPMPEAELLALDDPYEGRRDPDEGRTGAAAGRQPQPFEQPATPVCRSPISAAELAKSLLDAGETVEAGRSPTGDQVAELNRQLSADEVRQLAHAIDTGRHVVIGYESASGSRTRRTISEASLSGGALFAWCQLRNDERYFTVSRVLSVSPAL